MQHTSRKQREDKQIQRQGRPTDPSRIEPEPKTKATTKQQAQQQTTREQTTWEAAKVQMLVQAVQTTAMKAHLKNQQVDSKLKKQEQMISKQVNARVDLDHLHQKLFQTMVNQDRLLKVTIEGVC
jgi:hypothetical protein